MAIGTRGMDWKPVCCVGCLFVRQRHRGKGLWRREELAGRLESYSGHENGEKSGTDHGGKRTIGGQGSANGAASPRCCDGALNGPVCARSGWSSVVGLVGVAFKQPLALSPFQNL